MKVPSREDVAGWWRDVLAGRRSREQAHAWTRPWVEGSDDAVGDPVTRSGLQRLHGLDLSVDRIGSSVVSHGGGAGRIYLRTDDEVDALFRDWLADAAAFDADPSGWRRHRFTLLLRAERETSGLGQARALADRLIRCGELSAEDAAQVLTG